jgi:hypothetical protein
VGSIESQLRLGFMHGLRAGPLCRARLVHLVDGNVPLGEQRLDAVQVVFGVCRLGLGPIQRCLRVGDIGLRLTDRGCARSTLAVALRVAAPEAVTACTSA